ncbi:hypothetical protein [Branchiibius sp. NY16-3462-2]|uniref:hypothetical protein n=1 Tax=Branchiibius sp. NY16-3462-2 TaxID=1807500 RepID=UPI0007994C9C|nr:hypothetical protein [Branchiibius sp. NY16-3462-2]KYH43169.1 hypothetical protein AZH51_12465 [Branchiibius sp. NY16-3462-2]
MPLPRYFQPQQIVRSGTCTWLLDTTWPVALGIADDGSRTVQAWPWPLERDGSEFDHEGLADGVGIVVRDGTQVVWARRDGCVAVHIDPKLRLDAADPEVAWLTAEYYIDPGDPPAPAPPLEPGRIVAVRRDGTAVDVGTPAPVRAINVAGGDVFVTLSDPVVAYPRDGGWSFGYPTRVLRTDRATLLGGELDGQLVDPSHVPDTPAYRRYAWYWLDPWEQVQRYGVPADGLVWQAGSQPRSDTIRRRVYAVGHEPSSGDEVVRVDLGIGFVRDVQAVGDELWVAVARAQSKPTPENPGADVLVVRADGSAREVYKADTLDISQFSPNPRRPSQEEIDDAIEKVRGQFSNLGGFWTADDGSSHPLLRGLSEPSVSVEGDWPTSRVVVTFKHTSRPDLVLRRKLRIFDDEGYPVDHEYASIHLMEDLDTDHVPPAQDAVNGVLDI